MALCPYVPFFILFHIDGVCDDGKVRFGWCNTPEGVGDHLAYIVSLCCITYQPNLFAVGSLGGLIPCFQIKESNPLASLSGILYFPPLSQEINGLH